MTATPKLRLLMFNLVTDADDPILGFGTGWINALAKHCEAIDIITMQVGRLAVADNVRVFSVGKEAGYSEARRAFEFYRILWRLLREKHYDACFAHMMPLFAVMGAPLLKLHRIPITLWYAHKSVTKTLWLAEKVVRHVVTPSTESFRLPSQKRHVIGHGIDTDYFIPAHRANDLFTIVTIGRISRVKQLDTLVKSIHELRHLSGPQKFRLLMIGSHEEAYLAEMLAIIKNLDLGALIEIQEGIPYEEIVEKYQLADLMVNLSLTGSIDKAVLEAMSCEIPVITSNIAFREMLGAIDTQLFVESNDPQLIAQHLHYVMSLPPHRRDEIAKQLRQIVVEEHSLALLTTKLMSYFQH